MPRRRPAQSIGLLALLLFACAVRADGPGLSTTKRVFALPFEIAQAGPAIRRFRDTD